MAARAKAGQCGSNNSGKSRGDAAMTSARTIARGTQQDESNAATTTGNCGNGSGKFDSDGGGKSRGSVATTTRYRSDSGNGNKNDSKGNSSEKGERGGNISGSYSNISFSICIYLLAHKMVTPLFCLLNQHLSHDGHIARYASTHELAYFFQ